MTERIAKTVHSKDVPGARHRESEFVPKERAWFPKTDFQAMPIARKASCTCGGGCPACKAKSSDLNVSQPNDASEIEADHIADKVMRMPGSRVTPISSFTSAPSELQRKCSGCEDEEETIQRKPLPSSGGVPSGSPAHVTSAIGSGGQTLDRDTRSFFEPRFAHDLSDVRVHVGGIAAGSARSLNAQAYTIGNHIVFDQGQYSPTTESGKNLLAHELAHVIQHNGGSKNTSNDDGPIHRRITRENVSCESTGLRNPNLTGDEVIAALEAADSDAIDLAQQAETALRDNLTAVRAGTAVDPAFDTILQAELGLTLTNAAHFSLVEQQANRFQKVRETLESGFLKYMCRGGANVSLVGCRPGGCGGDFAFTCPGNRLMVLCQTFWDTPDQRSATILHEPFHIWFHMARHAEDALRRADSSCFESFALRVAGRAAFQSCAAHTGG